MKGEDYIQNIFINHTISLDILSHTRSHLNFLFLSFFIFYRKLFVSKLTQKTCTLSKVRRNKIKMGMTELGKAVAKLMLYNGLMSYVYSLAWGVWRKRVSINIMWFCAERGKPKSERKAWSPFLQREKERKISKKRRTGNNEEMDVRRTIKDGAGYSNNNHGHKVINGHNDRFLFLTCFV